MDALLLLIQTHRRLTIDSGSATLFRTKSNRQIGQLLDYITGHFKAT